MPIRCPANSKAALVPDPYQKHTFRRRHETRAICSLGSQPRYDVVNGQLAQRDPRYRANHQSNHFVKKAIPIELDREARTFATNDDGTNRSYRVFFWFAAVRGKRGKIMRSDELDGGGF